LLHIEATRVGRDTVLAGIVRLVEQAQGSKAPVQRLADRISSVFVPIVLVLATLTFLGWLLTGHAFAQALIPAIAVLVIACPCALGLATPTAIMVGTGRGAREGILLLQRDTHPAGGVRCHHPDLRRGGHDAQFGDSREQQPAAQPLTGGAADRGVIVRYRHSQVPPMRGIKTEDWDVRPRHAARMRPP